MARDYNIVWIVGDALQARYLGCYGCGDDTSPFIDSLASKGVLLEDFYSCSNHTDSSITSMMTGRYPLRHGILHHGRRVGTDELNTLEASGSRFLPEIISDEGFDTISIDWLGRWHRRGYMHYSESWPVNQPKEKIERVLEKLPKPLSKRIKNWVHGRGWCLPARSGQHYTDCAREYVRKNSGKPFFMFLHNWDTHTPFDTLPNKYKKKFHKKPEERELVSTMLSRIKDEKWRDIVRDYHLYGVKYMDEIEALYKGAVNFFDQQVKELVEELEKQGILEKTIIIITGDHGDNGVRDGVFVGHFGLYQPVVHVPLIMAGPKIPKGKRIRGFVQHIDIVPTLLEIIGIEYKGGEYDGKNLTTILSNGTADIREWALTFDGAARHRYSYADGKYKYIYSPVMEEPLIPFDTIGYRYQKELYNLEEDPDEEENIVDKNPGKTSELEKKLCDKIKELEDILVKDLRKNKKGEKDRIRSSASQLSGV